MRKKGNLLAVMFALLGTGFVAGCGTQDLSPGHNGGPSVASNVHAVVDRLPANLQAKLIGFAEREKTVKTLPIPEDGTNVLYISPMEQYAIAQFQQVWPRLKQRPVVVWTGTTETQAKSIWAREGYKSDPLPSAKTEYIQKSLPTPDSYHQTGKNTWLEVPGVLPANQVDLWVGFFGKVTNKHTTSSTQTSLSTPTTHSVSTTGSRNTNTSSAKPKLAADIEPNGLSWSGLPQANQKWLSGLFKDTVVTSAGQSVNLPTDKPLVFADPWCKYCHQTLQALQKNGLLNRVLVVNVAVQNQESGKDLTVNGIGDLVNICENALKSIGVKIPPDQMLYSMPGSALDKALTVYPTILVPHNGQWFVVNGYIENSGFWKLVLG